MVKVFLSFIPFILVIPSFFYFKFFQVSTEYILFALLVSLPLCLSIFFTISLKPCVKYNNFYFYILAFYILGSIYQFSELGIRSLDYIEFKKGLTTYKDGSEFKISGLAGLIGLAKLSLIFSTPKKNYQKYLALIIIFLCEVGGNYKRSIILIMVIPWLLIYVNKNELSKIIVSFTLFVLTFSIIGQYREGHRNVFENLQPMTNLNALNWFLSYSSLNYIIAFEKYKAFHNQKKEITNTNYDIYGFNASTYVDPVLKNGIFGICIFQFAILGFVLFFSCVKKVSLTFYLYINTLNLLNVFGDYFLERNFLVFLILICCFQLRFVQNPDLHLLIQKTLK